MARPKPAPYPQQDAFLALVDAVYLNGMIKGITGKLVRNEDGDVAVVSVTRIATGPVSGPWQNRGEFYGDVANGQFQVVTTPQINIQPAATRMRFETQQGGDLGTDILSNTSGVPVANQMQLSTKYAQVAVKDADNDQLCVIGVGVNGFGNSHDMRLEVQDVSSPGQPWVQMGKTETVYTMHLLMIQFSTFAGTLPSVPHTYADTVPTPWTYHCRIRDSVSGAVFNFDFVVPPQGSGA